MVVRFDVQVLPAGRAEPRAVGPAENLVGDGERELVARPGADVELALHDVLRLQLGVSRPVDRLVLLRLDLDVEARGCEAANARPVETRPEAEPEDVAGRRPLDDELGGRDARGRLVQLAPEAQRLERQLERLTVLLTGSEPEPAEGESSHDARVAPGHGETRERACPP